LNNFWTFEPNFKILTILESAYLRQDFFNISIFYAIFIIYTPCKEALFFTSTKIKISSALYSYNTLFLVPVSSHGGDNALGGRQLQWISGEHKRFMKQNLFYFFLFCCFYRRSDGGHLAADVQSVAGFQHLRGVPVFCAVFRTEDDGKQKTLSAKGGSNFVQPSTSHFQCVPRLLGEFPWKCTQRFLKSENALTATSFS